MRPLSKSSLLKAFNSSMSPCAFFLSGLIVPNTYTSVSFYEEHLIAFSDELQTVENTEIDNNFGRDAL